MRNLQGAAKALTLCPYRLRYLGMLYQMAEVAEMEVVVPEKENRFCVDGGRRGCWGSAVQRLAQALFLQFCDDVLRSVGGSWSAGGSWSDDAGGGCCEPAMSAAE